MKKDIELLEKIYKGTHIGSRSLNAMLPQISNVSLRKAVITQICEYDKINSDAKYQIANMGKSAQKPIMSSAMASAEAKFNTAIDSSSSHIAEVIIKGSNMGIINISKEINKSALCTPSVYNLGRKLLKTEEENVNRIKQFL